ncbi:MAG: hypothetical protein IKE94_12795 [Aeriscardovia sp.]|nr:hypothetical protein [Aeriscardovia sp.]
MTFYIEFKEDEIVRAIYELRRVATEYMTKSKYYDTSKCLLLSNRIEMQYRAQQQCDDQNSQKDPIE